MFEPDREVVAYRSAEECREQIRYYLEHPGQCEQIARAGQQRTCRDHSYRKRMEELAEMIAPLL
jgi:spore maturation protein CgeB